MSIDLHSKSPEDIQRAFERLGKEIREGVAPDSIVLSNDSLQRPVYYLDKIRLEPLIFQHRILYTEKGDEDEDHTAKLAQAIKDSADRSLEPVILFWTGRAYSVIDGFHRVNAYRFYNKKLKGKKDPPISLIPAKCFIGSLEEAIAKASELNSMDKLPMHQDDKQNTAWKFVVMGMKNKQINKATGVSIRTVERMSQIKRELLSRRPELTQWDLMSWQWWEARKEHQGDRTVLDKDEEYRQQQISRLALQIKHKFGAYFTKFADITAEALVKVHKNLPPQVMAHWIENYDNLEELAERTLRYKAEEEF